MHSCHVAHLSLSCLACLGIYLIRRREALLGNLPELGHVHAARDADARLADGGGLCQGAAGLLGAGLGLVKGALGDDGDVEALVVLRLDAALRVPLVKGDLVWRADQDGGDGNGVVQRRACRDAKYVSVNSG